MEKKSPWRKLYEARKLERQRSAVVSDQGLGIKKGIALSNGVGVIDSDYRGEVGMGLINLSDEPYTIQPGDRVAQMMISPVILPALRFVDELDETARGAGGLGSTGR